MAAQIKERAPEKASSDNKTEKTAAVPRPPKTVFEDHLKVVIAVVLFLLCVAFFAGLAWLLIVELDAKYEVTQAAAASSGQVLTALSLCGILY